MCSEIIKQQRKRDYKEMTKIKKFNPAGFYNGKYVNSIGTTKYSYKRLGVPDDYYTKTECKTMESPVRDGEEPIAFYRVKLGYCGLYQRDKEKSLAEKKMRKECLVSNLELTDANVFLSLYTINKYAKKSRDSKQEYFYRCNHGIVKRCKGRRMNFMS